MTTLLESVNSVLRKHRYPAVSTIDSTPPVPAIVDSLNEAASVVLRSHPWSFLVRHDGQLLFPATYMATSGCSINNNATTGSLNVDGSNTWSSTQVAWYTARNQNGRYVAKFRLTSDASMPNTQYRISDLSVLVTLPFTLSKPFRGTGASSGAFEVYCDEMVIPQTEVREILSVRHPERKVRLVFKDRHIEMDESVPNRADGGGDPIIVTVDGYGTGTSRDSSVIAGVSGMAVSIWPVPETDTLLAYSYIFEFPKLDTTADEWTGVPQEHVELIEWFAYQKGLMSSLKSDPGRAVALRRELELELARLKSAEKQPLVRRFLRPFDPGSTPHGYRSRWETQEVAAP